MPLSNSEKEFVDYVVELMQSIGPVTAKRMFGGHGIFLDGLMFGLIADSILYLKVNVGTEQQFQARGLEAFTYLKQGKECKLAYYQAPEEAIEESEQMQLWANQAYEVALKAATNKPGK